jgi:hypothetical protein
MEQLTGAVTQDQAVVTVQQAVDQDQEAMV